MLAERAKGEGGKKRWKKVAGGWEEGNWWVELIAILM